VDRGSLDVAALLAEGGAFAAYIVRGMLLQSVQLADQPALRLLGPGDVLSLSGDGPPLFADSSCTAAAPTELAMLGNEVLLAAHRWPRIVAGLHTRLAQQGERLAIQLAICQLPRVDQRVLALMWLLAESWGTVTLHGTRLPLTLTHDSLGGLVGARRPTVTLALRELTDRGSIIRQSDGWLLLEGPPGPSERTEPIGELAIFEDRGSDWGSRQDQPSTELTSFRGLKATVGRLREQHRRDAERFDERLRMMRRARERAAVSRRRIVREGLTRRQAPSS
jgi:hypothetical protein